MICYYYLGVEWRFWADLASQITMILFIKLTEAFPSPLITFCLRLLLSHLPEIVQQDTF